MPVNGAALNINGPIRVRGSSVPADDQTYTDGLFYCVHGGAPFDDANLPNQTTNFSLSTLNGLVNGLAVKPNYSAGSTNKGLNECRGAMPQAGGGGPEP
jgi:hypothetical protein